MTGDDNRLLHDIKFNVARLIQDCRDDYSNAKTLGAQFESAIAERTATACLRIIVETINEYMEDKQHACKSDNENPSGN